MSGSGHATTVQARDSNHLHENMNELPLILLLAILISGSISLDEGHLCRNSAVLKPLKKVILKSIQRKDVLLDLGPLLCSLQDIKRAHTETNTALKYLGLNLTNEENRLPEGHQGQFIHNGYLVALVTGDNSKWNEICSGQKGQLKFENYMPPNVADIASLTVKARKVSQGTLGIDLFRMGDQLWNKEMSTLGDIEESKKDDWTEGLRAVAFIETTGGTASLKLKALEDDVTFVTPCVRRLRITEDHPYLASEMSNVKKEFKAVGPLIETAKIVVNKLRSTGKGDSGTNWKSLGQKVTVPASAKSVIVLKMLKELFKIGSKKLGFNSDFVRKVSRVTDLMKTIGSSIKALGNSAARTDVMLPSSEATKLEQQDPTRMTKIIPRIQTSDLEDAIIYGTIEFIGAKGIPEVVYEIIPLDTGRGRIKSKYLVKGKEAYVTDAKPEYYECTGQGDDQVCNFRMIPRTMAQENCADQILGNLDAWACEYLQDDFMRIDQVACPEFNLIAYSPERYNITEKCSETSAKVTVQHTVKLNSTCCLRLLHQEVNLGSKGSTSDEELDERVRGLNPIDPVRPSFVVSMMDPYNRGYTAAFLSSSACAGILFVVCTVCFISRFRPEWVDKWKNGCCGCGKDKGEYSKVQPSGSSSRVTTVPNAPSTPYPSLVMSRRTSLARSRAPSQERLPLEPQPMNEYSTVEANLVALSN